MNAAGQNTRVGNLSLLQGIFPTQGSNPGLMHCRQILNQLSHKVKPKNTGVGSLSLLQAIFPTQELNLGLLHCMWILYQLSCQGSLLHISTMFDHCVVVRAWVGKEFPDMRQDEKRIRFIRVQDAVRTVDQLKREPFCMLVAKFL